MLETNGGMQTEPKLWENWKTAEEHEFMTIADIVLWLELVTKYTAAILPFQTDNRSDSLPVATVYPMTLMISKL